MNRVAWRIVAAMFAWCGMEPLTAGENQCGDYEWTALAQPPPAPPSHVITGTEEGERVLYAALVPVENGPPLSSRVWRFREGEWSPLGELGGIVNGLVIVPDGLSQTLPGLYAAGVLVPDANGASQTVVRWNGTQWDPAGDAVFKGAVRSLGMFDADGEGPSESKLVAWTDDYERHVTEVRILQRDTWVQLFVPTVTSGLRHPMADFDLDGIGPTPPDLLYVGDTVGPGCFHETPTLFRWNERDGETVFVKLCGGGQPVVGALHVIPRESGDWVLVGGTIESALDPGGLGTFNASGIVA